MDMDYLDPYRRRHPEQQPVQPFVGHQQAHPQAMHYPYWNPLMAYYQQQHRAAALMGQGHIHLSKPAEPKPRLAKDEVELLEREFAKNQKPSSSTKRELAEKMGVEVPRINNWFQNRRAKEKQIKKTAEFEAQQARERAASEAKSIGDRDQGTAGELCHGSSQNQNQNQHAGLSAAAFGGRDETSTQDDRARDSPACSDTDSFVPIKHEPSTHQAHSPASREVEGPMAGYGTHNQHALDQQTTFPYRPAGTNAVGCLPHPTFGTHPHHDGMGIGEAGAFSPYAEQDYFSTPSASQFPSEMAISNASVAADTPLLRHHVSAESLAQSEVMSPASLAGSSPSTVPDLRFKSPPPPADIAGRRKSRRPAPLGLSSLRAGSGPKTGIEVPRRADTVSPMRRISSATGSLYGRVQKTFVGSGGPRSPFATDRNREVLLQSLQEAQAPAMAVPVTAEMTAEGMLSSAMEDCEVGTNASEDDHGYHSFGSLGTASGIPLYNNTEPTIKSPPGTPGLQIGLPENYFSTSNGQSWMYAPQDEPLPTPSLCSHGGSELEFSVAPHASGYISSQPVTPSLPPTMGPTYTGYFAHGMGQMEYQFPDAYPAESSARSSPVVPPRSKQFQFAQNVTPQDFNTDKS
ncbi:hypothetical protein VTI28DRAFT_2831 [Corynascus sepedonium]